MRRLAALTAAGAALMLAAAASPADAQVRLSGQGGGTYTVGVTSWKDVPFRTVVRQQYDYSCGSAALATLLKFHYGVPVGEAEVFQGMWAGGDQAKITKVGFSFLDMKRHLEARGYKADGYRMSLDRLEQSKAPAIALIDLGNYRHFVVVKAVRGDKVLVGDPALGLKVWRRAEFEKMWNGVLFRINRRPDSNAAEDEWAPRPGARLDERLSDHDLSGFTRHLPPLYQLTPTFDITPVLP
ncbi:MAG TPA: C39 family peptidase [Caulobacteraceae bacterium]|nr:C39 family peptidase [Caulobacteraceae bacterium]